MNTGLNHFANKFYRGNYPLRISLVGVMILSLFALLPLSPESVVFGAATCATSGPTSGAYLATVCFTTPAANSVLVGNTTVTATVSVTGTNPGAQRMIFYLDNTYLLTDYQSPYTFTLPTPKWVDGSHSLEVAAYMRDGFTTSRTGMSLQFSNGVTTPPVNHNTFTISSGSAHPAGSPLVVAATGDGASGEANSSAVTNLVASWNPNLFLYLGDVYEKGSATEFFNWYGSSGILFSQFKSITDPTIGNHEYTGGSAPGYFDYWNNIPNYYSYTINGWHFISLNANSAFNQTSTTSAQYKWLYQDLASNTAPCTLVYYHQPVYNIGPEGAATNMQTIWSLLVQNKVDIVLNGHDHDYQHWTALNASGQPDPTGITEFVVGSGGHGLQTFAGSDSRIVKAFDSTMRPAPYGALRLSLSANSAAYTYINTSGTVLDSGTLVCQKASAGNPTPTPTLAVSTATSTPTATNTPVIVNSPTATKTPDPTSTPTAIIIPPTATPVATLTPTAQNTETPTVAAPTATPSPLPTATPQTSNSMTLNPVADAYVSSSNPGSNYGSATALRVDGSPDVHSYLKFDVQGLPAGITKATLLLYANSTLPAGINLNAVADTGWDEKTITYNNAPAYNSTATSSSGAIKTTGWVTLDVTPLIGGNGLVSFAVTSTGSTAINLSSKEAGSNAPQLVIQY